MLFTIEFKIVNNLCIAAVMTTLKSLALAMSRWDEDLDHRVGFARTERAKPFVLRLDERRLKWSTIEIAERGRWNPNKFYFQGKGKYQEVFIIDLRTVSLIGVSGGCGGFGGG